MHIHHGRNVLWSTSGCSPEKQGGNIIQNCDIYIGNAIRNSSWDLEESKWCDPFHQRWDLSVKERRKKYRDNVTSKPELMRSLSELRGKAFGCLCQSPHSCHGHVLVDLVMKAFSPEEDYCTKASKGNIYYFKGSFSPLSNFYPAAVVKGPPQNRKLQKKFRLGSFQLYYWQKAVNTGGLEDCESDMEGEIGEKSATVEQENSHSRDTLV